MKSILIGVCVIICIYTIGAFHGSSHVRKECERERQEMEWRHTMEIRRVKLVEEDLNQQNQELKTQLEEKEHDYQNRIAALDADYIDRLYDSEKRASHYQRLSRTSPSSSICLAKHAGALDKALVEGRRLVEEYRTVTEEWRERLDLCQSGYDSLTQAINSLRESQ